MYIDNPSVDTYLSHFEWFDVKLIPGTIHDKHVSSPINCYDHEVTVLTPNGPSSHHNTAPLTTCESPIIDFHSYPQYPCKRLLDNTSLGVCHTVNRKFIEDLLLPKQVSTFVWSNVIVNKPLNNNPNNNNIEFVVPENLVLNMSDLQLTDNQISIISRGLYFCPRPREPDMGQMFLDLQRLFKKMQLTLFWAENHPQDTLVIDAQSANSPNNIEISPYHKRDFPAKSTFNPLHLNQGLEPFQKAVKRCISSQPIRAPMTKYVTHEEIPALKEIQSIQPGYHHKKD